MRNAIGYFRSLNSINSWGGSLREEKHDWFLSERKGKKDQESAFHRRDNFGVNSVLKESRHRNECKTRERNAIDVLCSINKLDGVKSAR